MAKQDATVADSISRLCLAALVALINENNALFKAASEKQALQMLDHLVLTKRDHLKNIVKPIVEDILQELIGGQHQDGEIYQAHASRAAHPPNRPTIWASDKENIVKNNNATQQFNSMEDLSAVEDERQRMRQRSRSDKESDERLRERQLPIPSSDKGLEASLDREEM